MPNETNLYSAAEAIHGYGAQWKIGQGGASPETFVAVAQVISIAFGEMSTAVLDKTHLRSPAAHREKKAGLRDSGAFQMRCLYRPKHGSQSVAGGDGFTAGGLAYLWINRVERNMEIEIPDGSPATVLPFRGVITKYQPGEIGADGLVELSVEVTPLQDFSSDLP